MSDRLGEQLAHAMANKDADALLAVLAPDLDFKAMTPGRFWEATTAKELVEDVVLGKWLEPTDHIDELVSVEVGSVVDRATVTYRLRGHNGDGPFLVEQRAYFDVEDGQITWLRIMCSGFRPLSS